MNFRDLSWGALCFYYRSAGDRKYCRIMGDESQFVTRLRRAPQDITPEEFEQKVILDHVNIESYDVLIGHRLAERLLETIVEMHPQSSALENVSLLDCDLQNAEIAESVGRIYSSLCSMEGLWATGVSKIAHLLNDRLLAPLNLDMSSHFQLVDGGPGHMQWLAILQQNAKEVANDFRARGLPGTPEEFLSNKLGYSQRGCRKSLVKYLDEYFWLRYGDNLPVPPPWTPDPYQLVTS